MAAEQLTDKENQFRKRARRRLVGAVALVLLMITVLPLVLDDRSGQKAPQPEIAINIPSQDSDFSSKIIPIAAEQAAAKTPQMASPVEPPAQPPAAAGKPAEPAAPTVVEKAPVAKVEQSAKAEAPAVKPKAEQVAQVDDAKAADANAADTKPVDTKPADVKSAAKTAEPKPAEAKSAQTATAKKGTVSVQIGVFSDAAKVKQLRAKLAEKNVQCYTENLDTPKGVKIRLRCGPYPGKAEAQQALERVKAAGYDGILVTNQ